MELGLRALLAVVVVGSVTLAGCGGGHPSSADARSEAVRACTLEVGKLGNPQGTAAAESAAQHDPAFAKLAADAGAASTTAAALGASFGSPSADGTEPVAANLGDALEALGDDCTALGVTISRPIGGG